jgi:hypothetical protein
MVLIYGDGSRTEAFLLARTENKIRVAIPGSDDPLELTDVRGTWVSEDCEPVRVEFAWQGRTREQVLTEADCLCRRRRLHRWRPAPGIRAAARTWESSQPIDSRHGGSRLPQAHPSMRNATSLQAHLV